MSYIDLTNKVITAAIDATTTNNKRVLDYARATFDVLAKPYTATGPDAFVRENFDRASALIELRDKFLKDTTEHATNIANASTEHFKAVQTSAQQAATGVSEALVKNLNFVKEAAGKQIDGFTKTVEASVSSN